MHACIGAKGNLLQSAALQRQLRLTEVALVRTLTASPHKSGPANSSLTNDGSAEHIIRVDLEATRSAACFFSGAEFICASSG